jgi:hypothetical protein
MLKFLSTAVILGLFAISSAMASNQITIRNAGQNAARIELIDLSNHGGVLARGTVAPGATSPFPIKGDASGFVALQVRFNDKNGRFICDITDSIDGHFRWKVDERDGECMMSRY